VDRIKEEWELSRTEWEAKQGRGSHEHMVLEAYYQGKPVPLEVMAGYKWMDEHYAMNNLITSFGCGDEERDIQGIQESLGRKDGIQGYIDDYESDIELAGDDPDCRSIRLEMKAMVGYLKHLPAYDMELDDQGVSPDMAM